MTVPFRGPRALRCGLSAGFAGAALVALVCSPAAVAAPDPCQASEIAKTIGSVATSTGSYLESHPETNTALTVIAAQPAGPQSLAMTKTYFDANPEEAEDLQRLQAPLVKLSTQCRLPVSLPQLLGLMQAAQPTIAGPGPAVPLAQGTGPLPGPATG